MRQILLSPEFQLFSPFFIVLVLILLVSVVFLILRIMEVYNEIKSRKLLEKFFNETDGGDTMKKLDGGTMFEQALQGITPVGASGNQTALVRFLANATQGFINQSTGAVQKIQQLSMVRATSEAMRTGAQIIESVDSHIQAAQGQFDKEAPLYEATALGNVHPEQNNLGTSPSAETQSESLAEVGIRSDDIPIAPLMQQEVLVSTSAEASVEVQPLTETEAVELLKKMGIVRNLLDTNGVNPDTFSAQDLYTSLLDRLIHIFEEKTTKVIGGKKICSEEDERIFAFLLRLQTERNG